MIRLLRRVSAATCALLVSSLLYAADEVRLMHAHFTPYFENGFDSAELEGAIEVKNIGATKKVWLHYQDQSGNWQDHPAFYVAATTDNYEAFSFRLPLSGSVENIRFAIRYEVNGQTYWDNNANEDYFFDSYQQHYLAHQSVALDEISRSGYGVSVKARSTAHQSGDSVTLVYTLDDWAHTEEVNLEFSHVVADQSGFGGVWQGTFGVEYYQTMQFYLKSETQGQTDYDNYYRKDYTLGSGGSIGLGQHLQRYPTMSARLQQNGWSMTPMQLIDDYTWMATLYFEFTDFKFDAYGDWSRNFGDNQDDGIVDLDGANIKVKRGGTNQIIFNTQTGEYSVIPL